MVIAGAEACVDVDSRLFEASLAANPGPRRERRRPLAAALDRYQAIS
jgi:hypothetical protein